MENNITSGGVLDVLQESVIKQGEQNKKKDNSKYHFDKLRLFFGLDYYVKGIRIHQPTIGDILEIGEKSFYTAISPFINNSTSIRLMLWKVGIDWCSVKDIEVYQIMMNNLQTKDVEPLKLIFPDINFSNFKLMNIQVSSQEDCQLCLYNKSIDLVLFENEYMEIAEYIREMLNIHPKIEKAKGKTTKKWMIQEDEQNLLNKPSENDSSLLPLISSLINHPGFKYNLEELKQVGICQFYDAIQRLQIYEGTRALLQGSYSGFCDTSKINKEQFNFMRNIDNN